ncbi:hypothetical protein PMAYCL1PPCAC_26783, partial [Pristionchus mayeri]
LSESIQLQKNKGNNNNNASTEKRGSCGGGGGKISWYSNYIYRTYITRVLGAVGRNYHSATVLLSLRLGVRWGVRRGSMMIGVLRLRGVVVVRGCCRRRRLQLDQPARVQILDALGDDLRIAPLVSARCEHGDGRGVVARRLEHQLVPLDDALQMRLHPAQRVSLERVRARIVNDEIGLELAQYRLQIRVEHLEVSIRERVCIHVHHARYRLFRFLIPRVDLRVEDVEDEDAPVADEVPLKITNPHWQMRDGIRRPG